MLAQIGPRLAPGRFIGACQTGDRVAAHPEGGVRRVKAGRLVQALDVKAVRHTMDVVPVLLAEAVVSAVEVGAERRHHHVDGAIIELSRHGVQHAIVACQVGDVE
ncbi:hypothetical protein D3C86_1529320 [compost metagenome]